MNVKQKTLAALLVLGIGMSGCNTNDNNLPSQIVNKNTDENKTEGNRTIPTPPVENNESNGTVPGIIPTPPVENNESNGTDPVIIPVPPKQMLKGENPVDILEAIGKQHGTGESNITIAELKIINEDINKSVNDTYVNIYRSYIASADTTFSSPATVAQVQSMINEVNDFNLPEHAILDRSFFKKTNGKFEHRFVYLPVENTTTGRKWLNNNLGADYANVDSSDYNPSQQATAGNDYLAYGSMFQWGRKADGHELMNWVTDHNGTTKYGDTNVTNDNPSDSLFITKYSDWRVTPDDTLWASESSPNNVCPVGYRLPLNPNGAVDGEHELAVEINSWNSKDANGSMSSVLKLPTAGGLTSSGVITWWTPRIGDYWTGSVVPNSTVSDSARDVYFGKDVNLLDTSGRGIGFSVRCIKDQTPAERSATILKMIGNEHSNDKSTVTAAQLKAITPALENINDDYLDIYHSYIVSAEKSFSSPATRDEVQKMITDINDFITKNSSSPTLTDIATQHSNGSSTITAGTLNQKISILGNALPSNEKWYQGYIASADTHFSSPATLLEVQRMINEVNSFNIPANAVLDKNFFKKTRGKFEHRFVYLPVTNPTTGKTWLNNNLGAWYANVGRNMYDPSQQAKNQGDNYAKGSLFQWGRKADGHEIVGWWYNNGTIAQLAKTTTKSDNPTDGKFIAVGGDWRVHPNDDLWKGIDAPNNPCPAHYRVPTKEDLDTEAQTWNSLSADGSMSSRLKIPGPGWLGTNGYTMYYPGGEPRLWYASGGFAWTPKRIDPTQRTDGQPVRCIKN